MTRAYVYAMLPSLMSSFKISSMGEVIGTMQQDRATAIAGTLGKGPAVDSDDGDAAIDARGRQHVEADLHVQLVNDQVFTPLLDLRRARQHARRVRAAVRRRDVHASRAARRSRGTAI